MMEKSYSHLKCLALTSNQTSVVSASVLNNGNKCLLKEIQYFFCEHFYPTWQCLQEKCTMEAYATNSAALELSKGNTLTPCFKKLCLVTIFFKREDYKENRKPQPHCPTKKPLSSILQYAVAPHRQKIFGHCVTQCSSHPAILSSISAVSYLVLQAPWPISNKEVLSNTLSR